MQTLYDALEIAAGKYTGKPFLCIPPRISRGYFPKGIEITFDEMLDAVDTLADRYRASGWGAGHRVALALDNHPGHILHFLALNSLGVSQVPVNPYYLSHELTYLLDHSEVDMAVSSSWNLDKLTAVRPDLPLLTWTDSSIPADFTPAQAPTRSLGSPPSLGSEIALVYTSGTTARPKGAIIDNAYAFAVGRCYAGHGGALELREGVERVYLPLPFFHVNAGVNTVTTALLTGICLIVPDRFHASTWWDDLAQTRATAFHYLGIIPPVLMAAPKTKHDIKPNLRFGLGAGIDPALHEAFEKRFGVPMVEVWGMTETGRFLAACQEPRLVNSRAFGRAIEGHIEARVIDEEGEPVPDGIQGELVVRAPGEDPRAGFFRGYLKNEEATKEVWRDGWFHTGDIVIRDDSGMLHFCERSKNMIRRSGENISAAEVEDALIDHPAVDQVAVLAVQDDMRDEEVMACLVLANGYELTQETAQDILAFCGTRVAYYKVPAWVQFRADLPLTGTQKIQKHRLFAAGEDPRYAETMFDMRDIKSQLRKVSS